MPLKLLHHNNSRAFNLARTFAFSNLPSKIVIYPINCAFLEYNSLLYTCTFSQQSRATLKSVHHSIMNHTSNGLRHWTLNIRRFSKSQVYVYITLSGIGDHALLRLEGHSGILTKKLTCRRTVTVCLVREGSINARPDMIHQRRNLFR